MTALQPLRLVDESPAAAPGFFVRQTYKVRHACGLVIAASLSRRNETRIPLTPADLYEGGFGRPFLLGLTTPLKSPRDEACAGAIPSRGGNGERSL
jgi:hypothetical protein